MTAQKKAVAVAVAEPAGLAGPAPPPADTPADTPTWRVNWRLELDGKTYLAGDEINLDAAHAAPLLADGVIGAPLAE